VVISSVLRFLDYYSGVFALLGLTATVVIGLIATDRLVLSAAHRITAQVVHRAVALAAVALLVTHIAIKISEAHASDTAAFVPYHTPFYVGVGTLASDLFVLVLVVGLVRGRFAGTRAAGAWRALHALCYPAWALSIWHGLMAGRRPAHWVDWSYGVCLGAVGLAVVTRLILPAQDPAVRPAAPRERVLR
jgi:hypothetical protein